MSRLLIIGGTDSSGGAGLSRDARIAHALGHEVMPVVTAVTAQSDGRVFGVHPLPADLVALQIRAALASHKPGAIKIGMLSSSDIALAVAMALSNVPCPVVIDPVLRASSGGVLMSGALPDRLLARASVITPNLPEAAALTGLPLAQTDRQIAAQAGWFHTQGAQAVLIKGGHAGGATATDHLFHAGQTYQFHAPRLTGSQRGTGCALATAIACHLSNDHDTPTACAKAKAVIHGWMAGSGLPKGIEHASSS